MNTQLKVGVTALIHETYKKVRSMAIGEYSYDYIREFREFYSFKTSSNPSHQNTFKLISLINMYQLLNI